MISEQTNTSYVTSFLKCNISNINDLSKLISLKRRPASKMYLFVTECTYLCNISTTNYTHDIIMIIMINYAENNDFPGITKVLHDCTCAVTVSTCSKQSCSTSERDISIVLCQIRNTQCHIYIYIYLL